jgi:hypothetical protein
MEALTFSWSNENCEQLVQIMEENPDIRRIRITNEQGDLVTEFHLLVPEPCDTEENVPDRPEGNSVAHPSHYNQGKYEVKDVIRDWNLNFNLGNAVKYIARAPYKHPEKIIEDYEKAKQYIDFEIEYLTQNH